MNAVPEVPVLVVTGGSGSGKSTVARWLAERGAFVIDADRVGHETLLDPAVIQAIVAEFGDGVLDASGQVDRGRLGPLVFAAEERTQALNAIVHPPLLAEVRRRIDRLRESRAPRLIVVDAALHFQFDPPLPCDAVIMTRAPVSVRTQRLVERDGVDPAQVRDRLARQAKLDTFQNVADAVLETDQPPSEVRARLLACVDALFDLDLVESDPPRPSTH